MLGKGGKCVTLVLRGDERDDCVIQEGRFFFSEVLDQCGGRGGEVLWFASFTSLKSLLRRTGRRRERQNEEKRRRRFEDKTLRLFIASYLKDNMFESGEGVPYEVTTDVLYDAWVERTGIRYKCNMEFGCRLANLKLKGMNEVCEYYVDDIYLLFSYWNSLRIYWYMLTDSKRLKERNSI
jgi:hypothetical protein